MPRASLTLSVLPNTYAVCRLEPGAPIPSWGEQGTFWSATRTGDELSIVCLESEAPFSARREGGWRILKVDGPLEFALTGIMASIADPLAAAGVSIFSLATFDTDYVMIKGAQLEVALQALLTYGHVVHG